MVCHRGLNFLLFLPYLLLKTGLCFIRSVLPSLLHLRNVHLANSQNSPSKISSSDFILKQKTKAKERKAAPGINKLKWQLSSIALPTGKMKNQMAVSL